jgi:signal transduction histidine kinase
LFLDDAVAGAVDTVRALADSKGVRLDVAQFEEAQIVGDPALVRQLLLIVLDNAIKFTAAGGSVRLEIATRDGRAEVMVSDSGIGIPADQLPHVFERFYRGDAARRQAEGAGLGLAIARWIADAHGARIELQSEPRKGTRVRVSFPVAA